MRGTAGGATWLFLLLVVCPGQVQAGPDQQQVGAFLVFPSVVVEDPPGSGQPVESVLTLYNASPVPILAHVAFIDGTSCSACEFDMPMIGGGSDVLLFRYANALEIKDLDTGNVLSCPGTNGFVTVNVADFAGGTLTDNVLTGDLVVIDSTGGRTYSTAPITFQGFDGNDGNRVFSFDDFEYARVPRIVATQFLAPDPDGQQIDGTLSLFTLGFRDGLPPATECSVFRGDQVGGPPAAELQFGCWTQVQLSELGPDLSYTPEGANPESNWLQLDCQVDQNNDGTYDADGGVHGAILQSAAGGAVLRRAADGPALAAPAAWGRALIQSVTTGDSVALDLE